LNATVLFTGLPSAGKTTIARAVSDAVRAAGQRCEVLDGDEFRSAISPDLGYSREDRDLHLARVGYVARLLARNGVVVLIPVIAPYQLARTALRDAHETESLAYLEVYLDTPLAACVERDVKGLYAAARAGRMSGLTGVDAPYEPPEAPDAVLDTSMRDLESCVDAVAGLLSKAGAL
jgi:adenylylsulfate kinase